jgi:dTMP kinase
LQARKLSERLLARGVAILNTREPGGTSLGAHIRELVLNRADLAIDGRAEALLMNAARAQHVAQVIAPALERGEVVICDRFADSTLAYQGAGRGLDREALDSVICFATAGLQPDLTILLDLPAEEGLRRKLAQPAGWNRFEAEALAFHTRVRAGYQELARLNPSRWMCLDAQRSPDAIAADIWREVAPRVGVTP